MSLITFLLGIPVGVLLCWIRMREKNLDLQAEFDAAMKLNAEFYDELVTLRERRNNPWMR